MKVIKSTKQVNLVRADSKEAKNGFRYLDKTDGTYGYFVPMKDNSSYLYIRRTIKEGRSIFITPSHILIFNVQYNIAGVIRADKMVEPVELEVIVKGKE